jgi:transposase InsO family protein
LVSTKTPSPKEALVSHRRAKLTVAGRKLLIERILRDGWPVVAAAQAQGVSVATAYKWLRRYRSEGDPGLRDRSSRPHRSPRRTCGAREAAIVELRRRGRVGPHRIAWALGESRSTVYAVLRRHGLPRLAHLDRPTGVVVRYERARPGELIHIDVKRQARIPTGGGWQGRGRNAADFRRGYLARARTRHGYDRIHIALDDRSRVAYIEVHDDELLETARGFTTRAIAYFAALGVTVERVMTDNGSCYRRGYRRFLAKVGVKHVATRPYRPQTNGKVERFNHTVNQEWAYAARFRSNDERLATLPSWVHAYNHHRPHTALGGQTPMEILNNVRGNDS